jgi:magnesium-protoporphyrin IX monomethyl ester (oxidative) cyclase
MNITLIHPRLVYEPSQQPLGISYIAAALEESGHIVQLIEGAFTETDEEIAAMVMAFGADLVGISVMISYYSNSLSLAHALKAKIPDIPIVFGGPHPSAVHEDFIKCDPVDYVMVGECEEAFCLFANTFNGANFDPGAIPGLIWKDGCSDEKSAVVKDINSLKWPARHLLPMDKYLHRGYIVSFGMHGGNFNVITSRGCPFNCNFCDHSVFGNNVRCRDNIDVVNEIEYTSKKYNIRNFDVMDDTFTLSKKRVEEFCNELINRNLNLFWACRLRVTGVTREMLELMKKAGCIRFSVGIESVSERVLKATNKKISMEEVCRVLKWAKEFDFLTIGNFMIGNLGDTRETVSESLKFALETKEIDIPSFVMLTPLPRTHVFEVGKKNNWIRSYDWDYYRMNIKDLPIMRNEALSHEDLKEIYAEVAKAVRPKIQDSLKRLHEPRIELYPELTERVIHG